MLTNKPSFSQKRILFQIPKSSEQKIGDNPSAYWYWPRKKGRAKKGIIVLPITGGNYEVSTLFAEHFAKKGFQTLQIHRRADWLVVDRSFEELHSLFIEYQKDILRAIDAWKREAALDSVSLFGVSMGGIIGANLLAQRADLDAAVLCIAGAPLWEILAYSRDPAAVEFRKNIKQKFSLSTAALTEMFEKHLSSILLSPEKTEQIAEKTLFISAIFDRVIPPKNATYLWKKLGKPARLFLPTGHYSAAILLPWIKLAATQWFKRI